MKGKFLAIHRDCAPDEKPKCSENYIPLTSYPYTRIKLIALQRPRDANHVAEPISEEDWPIDQRGIPIPPGSGEGPWDESSNRRRPKPQARALSLTSLQRRLKF
jgi:hypothetical protein